MGNKNKLKKFAEFSSFPNTFEFAREMKGQWHQSFFKNDHPLVLELGCGKGEYTVELAQQFPDKNFIGVDIKGNRMWRGAKTAVEDGIPNVGFLRTQIQQIEEFFDQNEVDEIWITFPDPHPPKGQAKKRLTAPRFLDFYRNIIKPGGIVHLKTDSLPLHEYTLEKAQEAGLKIHTKTADLYASDLVDDITSIKTTYEQMFLKEKRLITYLKMQFPD